MNLTLKKSMVPLMILVADILYVSYSMAADHPNIIYILTDDMGYGDASCCNPESKFETPNIDAIAKDGMLFTDAHSSSGCCTPSRYSIQTGRYDFRTRLKRGVTGGHSRAMITPERMTVASLLKEHGYSTACIGKWHLGFDWQTTDGKQPQRLMTNVDFTKEFKNGPCDLGYDEYFGMSASLGMPPHVYMEGRKALAVPTEYIKDKQTLRGFLMNGREGYMVKGWDPHHVLPALGKRAVEYVKKSAVGDKPFFLYLSLTSPHTPVAPNKEFMGKSAVGGYGDFMLETDAVVGDVLAAVKAAGIEQDTIVYFTSDNGPSAGVERRQNAYKHFSSAHLRGKKGDSYEGGHRVPFMVKWPGKIKAGSVCKTTVCQADLLATTAEMLGAKLPENAGEDSFSNISLFGGGAELKPAREGIIHHSSNGLFAYRKGDWVINLHQGANGKEPFDDDHPYQLFNLKDDPSQKKNVFAAHPERVSLLKAEAIAVIKAGSSRPGAKSNNDPLRNPGSWKQLNDICK